MSFVLRHIHNNLWSGRLDIFPEDRLVHGFSARQGGVSPAPFDSLNMALHVGDDPARVWENRTRYFAAIGLDAERICTIRQVHGTEIVRALRRDAGRGARDYADALADADALITNDSGVPLMLCFADCVPVLLYDPVHHAAGVVHAGWKGTVARIAAQTIVRMGEERTAIPSVRRSRNNFALRSPPMWSRSYRNATVRPTSISGRRTVCRCLRRAFWRRTSIRRTYVPHVTAISSTPIVPAAAGRDGWRR